MELNVSPRMILGFFVYFSFWTVLGYFSALSILLRIQTPNARGKMRDFEGLMEVNTPFTPTLRRP